LKLDNESHKNDSKASLGEGVEIGSRSELPMPITGKTDQHRLAAVVNTKKTSHQEAMAC
jgi:hypothetical protein